MRKRFASGRGFIHMLAWIFILPGLYFTSYYNYLLFHSLAEMFSIIVACGIFMIVWNSRAFIDNNYLLFIGISYLFIGGLDLVHVFAYKGMGIFKGYGANLPTQFWIAARYTESVSLLIAPFFLNRKVKFYFLFSVYSLSFAILLTSIFAGVFPDCYVEGSGLTTFKIASEYLICLILAGSIFFLYQQRSNFDKNIFSLLVLSIIATIIAELFFTFYISVYGLSNLVGHYFKIISFILIYKAIIETGLVKPYSLLFRNLKQNEETLQEEQKRLKEALARVKTLSGLLPICSVCKKIRDDQGYWNQIEKYLEEHSEAEFSHGICPNCAKDIYPQLKLDD
jgi:hypothetical protein